MEAGAADQVLPPVAQAAKEAGEPGELARLPSSNNKDECCLASGALFAASILAATAPPQPLLAPSYVSDADTEDLDVPDLGAAGAAKIVNSHVEESDGLDFFFEELACLFD